MKSTFKIVGILLLLMFLKAEKCSEQNENAVQEKLINNMKKEIKSQFDADFLSEASLVEHEKAAKQKLADFADYLQILADSALKQPYREKAGEMIRGLFISDTVLVRIVSSHEMKDHEFSVRQLVQSGLNNELFISRIVYDSVQINQHFSHTGPNSYSAILSFMERKENNQDGTISGAAFSRKIMAQINKEYKIFAPDTLSVWVLHLGEIE
jgi:hypothetical protein